MLLSDYWNCLWHVVIEKNRNNLHIKPMQGRIWFWRNYVVWILVSIQYPEQTSADKLPMNSFLEGMGIRRADWPTWWCSVDMSSVLGVFFGVCLKIANNFVCLDAIQEIQEVEKMMATFLWMRMELSHSYSWTHMRSNGLLTWFISFGKVPNIWSNTMKKQATTMSFDFPYLSSSPPAVITFLFFFKFLVCKVISIKGLKETCRNFLLLWCKAHPPLHWALYVTRRVRQSLVWSTFSICILFVSQTLHC